MHFALKDNSKIGRMKETKNLILAGNAQLTE